MKRMLGVLLLVIPGGVSADQVILRSGRIISGVVVERSATRVVMEIGPGRIALPMSLVERVVSGESALATYRTRAAELRAEDAAGWLDLARWAEQHELAKQAREAYERVTSADPANADAQRALGHVPSGGRWLTPEEDFRARGYVLYRGRWMAPAERDDAVREEAQTAAAEQAHAAAEARVREAEARARAAEADARRAEADLEQRQNEPRPGIPLWGGGGVLIGGERRHADRPPRHVRPPAAPTTASPPPQPPPRPAPVKPRAPGASTAGIPDPDR